MAFYTYGQPASFPSYHHDQRPLQGPPSQGSSMSSMSHTPSYYPSGQMMGASPPGQMDTSGYLPPFLLGSPAPKSPSRLGGGVAHPSGHLSTGLSSSGVQGLRTSHAHRGTPIIEQSHLEGGKMNGGVGATANKTMGGPPVHGLYDHHPTTPSRGTSTPMAATGSPERRQLNFSVVNSGQRSGYVSSLGSVSRPRANSTPGTVGGLDSTSLGLKQRTPPSPAQMDPFYRQGETLTSEDDYPECWVTVFGFPSTASSFILEQFSQHGTILRHVVSSGGNWMHIMYQSRLQAKKALSKNGKVYGNGIMVGVQQCIDKSVMEGCPAPSSEPSSSSFPDTISHSSMAPSTPSKKPSSIRPLTAAYQASASQHQVAPNPNTPQKSSGFISKAFEYVFGW